ncbi:MAG: hypothetical protein MZV64_61030 [Ignavibacteriales bacterium]|nr:hypothetical protein [Ignavibacteriales bacterium]
MMAILLNRSGILRPESQRSIEPIQTTTLAGELSTSQHENTSTIFNYLKNLVVIAGKYALDNLPLAPTDFNHEETHFVKIDSDKTDVIGEDYFPDVDTKISETKPQAHSVDLLSLINEKQRAMDNRG